MQLKHLLFLFTALMISCITYSQKKPGRIAGVVKDAATKTPLYSAEITVSSKVLTEKKSAITDSTGNYRIENLPPGKYTITFEAAGFRTYTNENVVLTEGMSLGASLEMATERIIPDSLRSKKRVVTRTRDTIYRQ